MQRGIDLCRAAEGHAAPHRVRYRRGNRRHARSSDIKEQDVYMGDMPLMTVERHLHRQRHRARHRLADAPFAGRVLRPRQGQDPLVGQASVRRPRHSLSRFVARLRVRRQGHRARPHRPSPQAAGDDAAVWRSASTDEEILSTISTSNARSTSAIRRRLAHAVHRREVARGARSRAFDVVDAKTGEVVSHAGRQDQPAVGQRLARTASTADPGDR